MSESEYVDDYEDVSIFGLDDDDERTLIDTQTECTFMWTTAAGDPVGVIMNHVLHDGRFWLTCTRRRKRVAAIEARPRVAIAISSRGTDIGRSQSITYKGTATVHDDDETKAWFYPALAARVRPGRRHQAGGLRGPPRHAGAGRGRGRARHPDRV